MRKMNQGILQRLVISFLVIIASFITLQNVSAADESNALTPPPPPLSDITIMGSFDPNHKYLEDGISIISDMGDGDVRVSAITTGTGYIETLGAKLEFQKWTGSSWITVFESPSYTDGDARTLEIYANLNVETGYYYRIVSTHWAEQDGVYEQGTRYGQSNLID